MLFKNRFHFLKKLKSTEVDLGSKTSEDREANDAIAHKNTNHLSHSSLMIPDLILPLGRIFLCGFRLPISFLRSRSEINSLFLAVLVCHEIESFRTILEPISIPSLISVAGRIQCSDWLGLAHVYTSKDMGVIIVRELLNVEV